MVTCADMQVLSLEASLSAVHSERSQSDIGLKSRMQELLSELQSTLQVHFLSHTCCADTFLADICVLHWQPFLPSVVDSASLAVSSNQASGLR